ncbi:MAG: phosphoenolpyruvate synthase regulatory protein [Rhodospirillaceae bacterium]|nr:phosphoenolpyruvate synthase regulatory protein [Rhodospirillaceae bacterium]
MTRIPIHLVSDSTGETVTLVGRACLIQFDHVEPEEHLWSLVRTEEKVQEILVCLQEEGGVVIYTMADQEIRRALEEGCAVLQIPCIPVLDPIISTLGQYLGTRGHARPGSQHVMNAEYFNRIEAMQFALTHDDGQSTWDLDEADVVLLGVSRTSKTPTCIYLANRGIKTANVPIVPGCPIPKEVFEIGKPLIIGLTKDPKRLVEIRRQRLRLLDQDENTDYVNLEMVSQEINEARRLFSKHEWPIINVSRKSIEETAATILQLYQDRLDAHL